MHKEYFRIFDVFNGKEWKWKWKENNSITAKVQMFVKITKLLYLCEWFIYINKSDRI